MTRSLVDFARLVEVFDRNGVSFDSVTQPFNTTKSMGRLALNILLPFARSERELMPSGDWKIPAAGQGDGGAEAAMHVAPILTALSRAFHWPRLLDEGRVASGSEIARRAGLHPTTVNELLRLTLLLPTLVTGLLAGRQPRTLSLIWLKNREVRVSWGDQAALFGRMDRWTFDTVPMSGVDSEPPRASC